MKRASVIYPYHTEPDEVWILDSIDSLLKYDQIIANDWEDLVPVLFKVPVDRWDHIGRTAPLQSAFNKAILDCKVLGKKLSIFTLAENIEQYKATLLKNLMDYGQMIVNDNGGFCPLSDEFTVVDSWELDFIKKTQVFHVGEKTKYINLENDPELEEATVKYLSNLEEDYSYVCYLRNYSKDELSEIFKTFVQNGGKILFQYTTGLDAEQMYEYSKIAIKSGVKDFEFWFNTEDTYDRSKFIEWLDEQNVTVSHKIV